MDTFRACFTEKNLLPQMKYVSYTGGQVRHGMHLVDCKTKLFAVSQVEAPFLEVHGPLERLGTKFGTK